MMSKRSKRPVGAVSPFPWECPQCRQAAVEPAVISYDAEVRHDGRVHEFNIPDLEVPVCAVCGAKVFTESVDLQISAALRAHLNLLTPQQISESLRRLNMSQKEAASCLGIAEATLSRWLNDIQIQSRAMDNYLRTFFSFPDVREALCRKSSV